MKVWLWMLRASPRGESGTMGNKGTKHSVRWAITALLASCTTLLLNGYIIFGPPLCNVLLSRNVRMVI